VPKKIRRHRNYKENCRNYQQYSNTGSLSLLLDLTDSNLLSLQKDFALKTLAVILIIVSILLYLLIAVAVAVAAKNRQVGMFKVLAISIFFTPLVGYFIYANSKTKNHYYDYRFKCPICGYQFTENHTKCPFCAKEGKEVVLKRIVIEMT